MTDQITKEVQEAIEKRDQFLKDNPHLQPFQDKINETMDKTPDHLKFDVITTMLIGKLLELQNAALKIAETLDGKR